ncbi:hypothetical protein ABCS02_10480 [Microbacterium sp. X-17]|uniref:type IV toxin-antitoxin system AbiEi family antitoxin domain-containing protein n=1 Tax=Microbacterium sp. X-17 TaxID=3144404 RepID=UPI0031F5895F
MAHEITIAEAGRVLRRRTELVQAGWSERELTRAEEDRRLIRVRRSWFVESEVWGDLWPEGRHLLDVVAAAEEAVGGYVFSYASAAAVWGLPLYRWRFDRVHVTGLRGLRASGSSRLIRHEDRLDENDVELVGGLRCTSLERTVFDLVRAASLEAGVSAADAALGRVAVTGRVQADDLADGWRERMRERAVQAGAVRGVKQLRWVIGFADGRAELPGESVSRLQLYRLGFATPRLQIPVSGPGTPEYWIDLGLDDVDCWMEFDGEGKYRDEALRSGRSLEDVLLAEKRREDTVRGLTGRRFVRMESRHLRSPSEFGRRLASFGIHSLR